MSEGTKVDVRAGAARWLPFTALLLVVAVLLPWRGASDEQLAALSLPELLTNKDDNWVHETALAVLASDYLAIEPSGTEATLRLGRVDVEVAGAPTTGTVQEVARRSLVQALRTAVEIGFERGGAPYEGLSLLVDGELEAVAGGLDVELRLGAPLENGARRLELEPAGCVAVAADWRAPTRFSLLPPIVAIALAIATRKPLLSLFSGVLVGAILVQLREGAAKFDSLTGGLLDVPARYFWGRFNDGRTSPWLWEDFENRKNLHIILFVIFMLAMVGNTIRNGGIAGIMHALAKRAKDARSTQIATWLTGLAVFFDDYANTVLVGSTMRPLTDRFRVSREKLAYIVDSTAAPVAGISIFSTWIAFEVSTFSAQLPAAHMATTQGYEIFIQTLPFRFYCIFTLFFVALIAFTGRDFGSMGRAERRARSLGQVLRPGATPLVSGTATEVEMAPGIEPRAWRALVPLFGFIGTTLFKIAYDGGAFAMPLAQFMTLEGVTSVLYGGSGNYPLMLGGLVGFVLAALASAQAGIVREVPLAAWRTLSSMGVAFGILYSAWMVSDVCEGLGTAHFLTAIVSETISAPLLPMVLIILAGLVAFATGSSWSTMGILLPMVVGVSYQLGEAHGMGGLALMVLCIGAVLEGAIFGDHCSPISDTTVLSSISSASDHIDHVRTQAPYALVCMGAAIGAGYVPAAFFGVSPWICLPLGMLVLVVLVFALGRRSEPA